MSKTVDANTNAFEMAFIEIGKTKDKDGYQRFADMLNKADGKANWGWRYAASLVNGSIAPSKKVLSALEKLTASLDGLPMHVANAKKITAWSFYEIPSNTYIHTKPKYCANPDCPTPSTPFLPNTPRRKNCFTCSPISGQ